jgi:hypothetical protein
MSNFAWASQNFQGGGGQKKFRGVPPLYYPYAHVWLWSYRHLDKVMFSLVRTKAECTYLNLFLDLNVPLVTALFIEKLISHGWISWTLCKTMHICNLVSVLLVPAYIINFKYEFIGPGIRFRI